MEQKTTIDPKLIIDWLDKLVAMAQWDAKLPFYTARLFSKPKPYQQFLMEAKAETIQAPDMTTDPGAETPFALAHRKLLERIAHTPQLHEMFAADPEPFNGASVELLRLLAEVSDITPDPQSMVSSRNGTFLAVVEALRQSKELQVDALLVDGLNKFLTLLETNEPIAEMLFQLASSPYWYVVLASLRDNRDYILDEERSVAQTLTNWQTKLTTDLRALLFKPGHLSRAPIALIKIAWTERSLFKEARESISLAERETDPFEARRQVSNAALPLFEKKAETVFKEIEAELKVLAIVARHFIDVRKFAKLDGFVYTWPEISRLAMANYTALEYVEELLLGVKKPTGPDLEARDAGDLYAKCEKNKALLRFLRLRPYFREIDDDELRRYRPLAPVVITDTPPQSPPDAARAADFTPKQASPAPPSAVKHFEVRTLRITRKGEPEPSTGIAEYDVAFSYPGFTSAHKVKLSVAKLLDDIRGAVGAASDGKLQEMLKELFSSSPTVAEGRMMRGGGLLQNAILSPDIQKQFVEVLARRAPMRLVIDSPEKEIHFLPWEWLPALASPEVLLSSPDYSIVRGFSPPTAASQTSLLPPLHLLSILPSAPSGRRFTSNETLKNLRLVVPTEGGEHKSLAREQATLANVKLELKDFAPPVVHFEGYVISLSTSDVAVDDLRILFSKPDNEGIPLGEFGAMLKENEVRLLVIGRNGVSRIYDNPGVIAALQVMEKGLEVMIAPIRAIDDASATTFTTEFHRAFLQGNTLEAALHLARRKLASKGGDWSVFGLFADPARLDYFQLLRETA